METKAMTHGAIRVLLGLAAVVVLLRAGIVGAAEPPSLDKYKPKDKTAVIKAASRSSALGPELSESYRQCSSLRVLSSS
jgi:hypothetical protein